MTIINAYTPTAPSYWNTTPSSTDPWASQKAAAAGAAAGSSASSAAAGAAGTAQQQAQYGAMSQASGLGATGASAPAGLMTPDDIARAIAASSHAGANASSMAAGINGQAMQSANAGAMASASKTMADMYGAPALQQNPQPAPQGPAYDPMATNIPFATWDNLQPYFNPMYQFLLDSGTNAIQNSAAARGMLHSSGTINDIGDWAAKAGSQAYDSAVQNFMNDRMGVYNIGSDLRNFDWENYKYQNQQGLDAYNANKSDYQTQLSDFYKQLLGLSEVGQTAANNAGKISGDSATAMANLFMAMAQMQAMSGQASANNQSSFMGSLFSMIPMIASMVG